MADDTGEVAKGEPIAFSEGRERDAAPSAGVTPTLRKGGSVPAVIAIQDAARESKAQGGLGLSAEGVAYTLDTLSAPAIFIDDGSAGQDAPAAATAKREKTQGEGAKRAALDERVAAAVRPFVERFMAAHERAVESTMAMADALHEAKQAIPYGDFTRAFKGARNPLPGGAVFPISIDVAERYMRLRKQPAFRDSTLTRFLPASYSALYELVPINSKVLERAILERVAPEGRFHIPCPIQPDMTVAQARRVAAGLSDRALEEQLDRREEQERRAWEKRLASAGLALGTCTACGRNVAGRTIVDAETRVCARCKPFTAKHQTEFNPKEPHWLKPAEPCVWSPDGFRQRLKDLLYREQNTYGVSITFEQRIPALARELRAMAALLEDWGTEQQNAATA